MFLKILWKGGKVRKNDRFFFQNKLNDGFWNFEEFWNSPRGKKGAVNYFLYECKHIIKKKWKN